MCLRTSGLLDAAGATGIGRSSQRWFWLAFANVKLAGEDKPPVVGVTNHSLRRTYASLLYEA
jgi:integrase